MVLREPLQNFFPNIKSVMKLLPTRMALRKTALPNNVFPTKTLQFITTPSMNKITFREYMQKVYGLEVTRMFSVNFLGKRFRQPLGKGIGRRQSTKKMMLRLRHWVQLPFAPRRRASYEEWLLKPQRDYSRMLPSDVPTAAQRRQRRHRRQRDRLLYDPELDPYNRAPRRPPDDY